MTKRLPPLVRSFLVLTVVSLALLGLVNSVAQEDEPDIASDRETLHFRSNRVGGIGGQDLYVTTRTKQKAEGASR